jgi:hypothetical protein
MRSKVSIMTVPGTLEDDAHQRAMVQRDMNISPEEVRAKLEAGRAAVAGQLRLLAHEIETLPLEGAAETLSWFGNHIERILREAERIVRGQAGPRRP